MEREKNSNGGLVVAIVVLTIGIVGLLAFIIFGGSINFDKNKSTENNNVAEVKDSNKEEKVKGECSLTKFDSSYVLTDEDKDEIISSIESFGVYTKDTIDKNSLVIKAVSDSGYAVNVAFDAIPNTCGSFAKVVKVNGKLKTIFAGCGTIVDIDSTIEDTLKAICK